MDNIFDITSGKIIKALDIAGSPMRFWAASGRAAKQERFQEEPIEHAKRQQETLSGDENALLRSDTRERKLDTRINLAI